MNRADNDDNVNQVIIGKPVIKNHQASMAEINNHKPRIDAMSGTAQNMMEEGHFASEDIKPKAKILKPRLKL